MGDTAITEVKDIKEDVEIFDDDNREEEEKGLYFQEPDYGSVVISNKIKDRKKLLKEKFNKLNKQSALLYSYESCKQLFDRIDKPANVEAIGIMQHTEVANYLIELRKKKEFDYIDEIFLKRFNLTKDTIPTAQDDGIQTFLGNLRKDFPQLGYNIEDSSINGRGIRGVKLLEFIEFMNEEKKKKNHSKEILLLTEIIDIAEKKIKYEIVDCRLKGIKGTILILKANSLILNIFKKFLDDLRQGETRESIQKIISDFDNIYLKELISLSKSKIYLEYQHVRFDQDAIEILYHEDRDVLVKILEKQAQELLDAILYLKKLELKDKYINQLLQIQIQAMTLAVQAKTLEEQAKTLAVQKLAKIVNTLNTFIIAIMKAIIVGNDYHQLIIDGQKNAMYIIRSVEKLAELVREEAGQARTAEDEEDEEDEDDAVGTEYDIQVIIEEIDDINKQKLEKILSIIQDFIYTECIDYIENSLADSIITLKLSSIEKKFEIEVKIQKLIEDTKQERIAYGATTSSRQETPLLHDGTVNIVLGNLTKLLKETENRVYLHLPEAQKEVINAIKAQNYDSMVEDHIEDNDKDKASIALIKTHAAQAAYKAQHALINTVSLLKDTAFIIQSAQDFQKQNVEQIIINTKDLKQKALELAEIALIKAKEALEKDEMEQDDEKTVIQKTTDLLYRREEALKIVKNAMEVEGITKFSQNLIDRVSILDLINILQKAHEALEKAKITLLEEAKTQILKTQIDVRKIVTFAINSANQAIIKQDEEVQDVEYLGIKAQEKVDIAQQALGQLFDALHALEKAELIEEQKGEEPERIKINLLRELNIRQEELANKAINNAIVTLTNIELQIKRADGLADFMPTINLLNLTLEKPYNKDSVHNALDNAKRLLNDIAVEQTTSRIKVEEAQSKLIEAYRMQNKTAYSLTDGILQTNIALDALKIVLDTLNRPLITLEQKYNLLIILVKLEQIALEQAKQVVSQMIYEIPSYDIDEHVKSEAFNALTEDIRNVVQKQELLSQLNSEEQNIQLIMTTVIQALEALEKAKTTLTTYQNTTRRQGGKKQKKKKSKKGEILTFKF
jgi:hypothetical protein